MKILELDRTISDIPSAVLWDILGRLSIKTCLTCKLVCKEWYHIIITPEFSDFRHSIASRFTLLFNNRFNTNETLFYLGEVDNMVSIDDAGNLVVGFVDKIGFKPKLDTAFGSLKLDGQCSGCVCLTTYYYTAPIYSYICNMLTCQYVTVKYVQRQNYSFRGLGFGCCELTREFKVLMVSETEGKYVAEIQTTGTDEWRRVGNAPIRRLRGDGQFLNSCLHWYCRKYIRCFHFGDEKFLRFQVSDRIKYDKSNGLTIFQSCLCLCCPSQNYCPCDIWIMKEHGKVDSWVRQFVIEVKSSIAVPLFQIHNGEILVYDTFGYYSDYNPETGRCKEAQLPQGYEFFWLNSVPYYPNFSRLLVGS